MQTKTGQLDKLARCVLFIGFNFKTFCYLDRVFFFIRFNDRGGVEAFPLSLALGNYENIKAMIMI